MSIFTVPNKKARAWFNNAICTYGISINADMDLILLPFLPFCWVYWVFQAILKK